MPFALSCSSRWSRLRRTPDAGARGQRAPTCVAAALTALSLLACQPELDIGDWTCSADGKPSVIPEATAPVAPSWSTGFEDKFCDYSELAGFCYADPSASVTLVTSPVHSGHHAAAFTVQSDANGGSQTRCVRQGSLPTAAYYGAWYYIPEPTKTAGNWNLFHFRGGATLNPNRGFMDVSLVDTPEGLQVAVFGPNHSAIGSTAEVPVGAWFHVQLFLVRAADTGGEVALYLDGQQVFDAPGRVTDDTELGQWYVGNLADALTPSTSTLYVDDVTISSSL